MEGLEIGTLINNVGMAYPYPEYFLDMPNGDKLCMDMIFCNLVSVTMMIRVVSINNIKISVYLKVRLSMNGMKIL